MPAAQIEEVARIYGSGPALLWLGQGLQRQAMGGNVIRACALLPAVTGNFGRPGAGLLYLNGGARKGVDGDYLSGARLSRSPPSFSQMELAARLEDPADIQAFLCWNINPAASSPEQARFRRALMRDDLFTVVVDIFQTDTADYADYVLPAASFLEFDDLVSGYFNLSMSAQAKLQEPLGESLPNQEIFRRLARAMGYQEPELYEDDETIIERIMGQVGVSGSFDAFKRIGTVYPDGAPVIQFPDLAFPTPSGKIEIASARAEADGHPRLPLAEADPKPGNGRLRLLSPASPWLMNDSYANDRRIADRLGRGDGDAPPGGRGGSRPCGGAAGAAQQRDRQPGACARRRRDDSAGRGAQPQGPLAAPGGHAGQRQRAQPRHQVGHGREHLRARRRGRDCRRLSGSPAAALSPIPPLGADASPIRRCRGRRAWRGRSGACRRRRRVPMRGSSAPAGRCDLVDHRAAGLVEAVLGTGRQRDAKQRRVGGIARQGADGDRARVLESVILDDHDRARLAGVVAAARCDPELARLHPK